MVEFYIYAEGLPNLSVCVPKDMTRSEVERHANDLRPTGVQSDWKISKDKTFFSGESMPCECNDDPAQRHWLLNC